MKAKLSNLFILSVAIGVAVVVLNGCRPSTPTATPVPPTPTVLPPTATSVPPTPTALPPTPTATPAPIPEPPEALQATLWQLASQFRVSMDQVHLVRWEQIDWPDGCLSISMRDACTQAAVPGYRIVVEVGEHEYEYRSTLSDAQPYRLLLAAGPNPGIEEPALVWEGQVEGRCRSLILAADGRAAMGPCDAPHAPRSLLEEMGRPQQWADLLARFAPFEAETPSGWVRFQGQGREAASPAWQRAVAAWARLVRQELLFGRSGASWGAAMAWHREMPERPGYCQFLQVEVYGVAYASIARCEGGDPQYLGQGWLETAEWEQFDAWFYGWAPVYHEELDFFGTGTQEMSESEVDALRRWVEAVYSRLTVEASAPTPTITPISAGWKTYTSPDFHVTLQHPAHWQPRPGYGESYGGEDGLFGLNAVSGEGVPLDEVAQRSAYHKLQPYGSQPVIESLQGQGQPARLILPSADQPEDMKGQAELIVLYPQPVTISGEQYRYFVLYADQGHVRQIAETLSFVK